MRKITDTELWEKIKASVRPLVHSETPNELPPRLKVRRAPVVILHNTLDLHQKTLEEAYNATEVFLCRHFQKGTKRVQIITGKGHLGGGLIRSEFAGWLDTPKFKAYIRTYEWTHDKGAMNLWLKKNKSF